MTSITPITNTCRQCPAVYSWLRGPSDGVYLCCNWQVDLLRRNKKDKQVTMREWLQALDPASWDVSWDVQPDNHDLHSVTWCENARCKMTSKW
jgi:hypothetical protein